MRSRYLRPLKIFTLSLAILSVLGLGIASATGPGDMATYEVTIRNISNGQPLSPPVVATHQRSVGLFRYGRSASPELEALAEDGNEVPLFNLLNGSPKATDVIDVGMPLTRRGQVVGDFSDSVTIQIQARPGDAISLASMLICTNDGFVGLDRSRLPRGTARRVYPLIPLDAGTEQNTEMSADIVDACGALGSLPLPGDGNEDDAVNQDPQNRISLHRGIRGTGDLSAQAHGWRGITAVAIVKRIN